MVKLRLLRWEIILDCPGGINVITGVLIRERERRGIRLEEVI